MYFYKYTKHLRGLFFLTIPVWQFPSHRWTQLYLAYILALKEKVQWIQVSYKCMILISALLLNLTIFIWPVHLFNYIKLFIKNNSSQTSTCFIFCYIPDLISLFTQNIEALIFIRSKIPVYFEHTISNCLWDLSYCRFQWSPRIWSLPTFLQKKLCLSNIIYFSD